MAFFIFAQKLFAFTNLILDKIRPTTFRKYICKESGVNMALFILGLAHHLWILAVLGGLGANGWYQLIILTYMISFINLSPQNNHNPYDRL